MFDPLVALFRWCELTGQGGRDQCDHLGYCFNYEVSAFLFKIWRLENGG